MNNKKKIIYNKKEFRVYERVDPDMYYNCKLIEVLKIITENNYISI